MIAPFHCKYLAGDNVGRTRRWYAGGEMGEVCDFSFILYDHRKENEYHKAIRRCETDTPQAACPTRLIARMKAHRTGAHYNNSSRGHTQTRVLVRDLYQFYIQYQRNLKQFTEIWAGVYGLTSHLGLCAE